MIREDALEDRNLLSIPAERVGEPSRLADVVNLLGGTSSSGHISSERKVSTSREATTCSNDLCNITLSEGAAIGLDGWLLLSSGCEGDEWNAGWTSFVRDCMEAEDGARSRCGRC